MRRTPYLKGSRPSVKCKESADIHRCGQSSRRGPAITNRPPPDCSTNRDADDSDPPFKVVRGVEQEDLPKLFTLDFLRTVGGAEPTADCRRSFGFLVRKAQSPLLITWQQVRASDSQLHIPFIFSRRQIHQSFKASGSLVITPSGSRARHSSENQGALARSGPQIRWINRIPPLCPSYSQAPAPT